MITKQQASTLYAYDYKLQDNAGKVFSIYAVYPTYIVINDEKQVYKKRFERIGTDYKILCRPPSDLTKEITHKGETFVPIVEMAKKCYRKVFSYLDHETFQISNISYYDTDFGKMLKFECNDSFYKFTIETTERRKGFYFIRDNDINYYLNQDVLFEWLDKHHFIRGVSEDCLIYITE